MQRICTQCMWWGFSTPYSTVLTTGVPTHVEPCFVRKKCPTHEPILVKKHVDCRITAPVVANRTGARQCTCAECPLLRRGSLCVPVPVFTVVWLFGSSLHGAPFIRSALLKLCVANIYLLRAVARCVVRNLTTNSAADVLALSMAERHVLKFAFVGEGEAFGSCACASCAVEAPRGSRSYLI
jgi:uncharacterized membrane protein